MTQIVTNYSFIYSCKFVEFVADFYKQNGHVTACDRLNNASKFYHSQRDKITPMKRISSIALVSLFTLVYLFPASSILAQTELVANGSLDSYDSSGIASGWTRWWEETANPNTGDLNWAAKPDWGGESNSALTLGGLSQHIGTQWNPWHAGQYQIITASPNAKIHITASGRLFASNDNFPSPSDTSVPALMQIGADPNGGTEWWSGNVQWSGAGSPHDTWQTYSLDVTAGASGKVTIFLSVNYKGSSRFHVDAWWDNVSAQVLETAPASTATSVGDGATPVEPPATAAPTSSVANPTATTLAPTPSPVGAATTTATQPAPTLEPSPTFAPATEAPNLPATACVTIFEDVNGNGTRDADDLIIPDSTITLDNTTSNANPYCFENLTPGQHTFKASMPSGYFSTTGDQITVNLTSGQQADIQFGAQSSRLTQPQSTATPVSDTNTSITPILIGVGAILLLAIGGAIAFIIRQTRR